MKTLSLLLFLLPTFAFAISKPGGSSNPLPVPVPTPAFIPDFTQLLEAANFSSTLVLVLAIALGFVSIYLVLSGSNILIRFFRSH